jgi:hypothetical protein
MPISVDSSGDHHDRFDYSTAFTHFHGQRISKDQSERASLIQEAVKKLVNMVIMVCRPPPHLGFRQGMNPQRFQQFVRPPSRHSSHTTVSNNRHQSSIGLLPTLSQPFGKLDARLQFWHLNLLSPNPSIQGPGAVTSALIHPDRRSDTAFATTHDPCVCVCREQHVKGGLQQ